MWVVRYLVYEMSKILKNKNIFGCDILDMQLKIQRRRLKKYFLSRCQKEFQI